MLRAGWDAHTLNAPGKFLISAPGHDRPKRARGYLLTDEVVAAAAARYANDRPRLDKASRRAIDSAGRPNPASGDTGPAAPDSPETADARDTGDNALWLALCQAPAEGTEIGELLRMTGWKRTKLYRHLRQYADAGRAIQVSRDAGARGGWRSRHRE
jgi:DNA segregation ATPase FtsK/SpoIIIE, S-DNA-T family